MKAGEAKTAAIVAVSQPLIHMKVAHRAPKINALTEKKATGGL
ncbi:hypothetical protein C4J97_5505 [Pseudomonas orientalis]|nr:hypothetical protein C4J97_5505 [Pseudomonas orientalis]